jgi:hypothetical protein
LTLQETEPGALPSQGYQRVGEAWEISSRLYDRRRQQELAEAWASYHGDQAGRLESVLTERVAYHRREQARYRAMLDIQPKGEVA